MNDGTQNMFRYQSRLNLQCLDTILATVNITLLMLDKLRSNFNYYCRYHVAATLLLYTHVRCWLPYTWKFSLDKNFAKPSYLCIAERVHRKKFSPMQWRSPYPLCTFHSYLPHILPPPRSTHPPTTTMCDVLPAIGEETPPSSPDDAGDNSKLEQLMISMLEERDKLMEKLRESQEAYTESTKKLGEVETDNKVLLRQLQALMPQVCKWWIHRVGGGVVGASPHKNFVTGWLPPRS